MPVTTTSLLPAHGRNRHRRARRGGRTDPAQLLARAKSSGGRVPWAASAVSARASSGTVDVFATAPGTVRLIFSGHDGSACGDSGKIVKFITPLQLVRVPAG
jgi:hypothetical protein